MDTAELNERLKELEGVVSGLEAGRRTAVLAAGADLLEGVSGLEAGARTAVLGAVVGLLEGWLPDPFGEKRPDAARVLPVQELQVIVNRLREAASRSGEIMSASGQRVVLDPTLYRAFCFLGRLPSETEEEARHRRQLLENVLGRLGWMPEQDRLPVAPLMQWRMIGLWDQWQDALKAQNEAETWNVHRYAQSHHEEIVVLLGVEQDGPHSAPDDWARGAHKEWDVRFGGGLDLAKDFALPNEREPQDRPRVLGQAWVWTGEWEAPPEEGWEAFGRAHYAEDSFVVFSWGLLGYRRVDGGDLPRFDLHTTRAERKARDEFLYTELTTLLLAYLKSVQFLVPRYKYDLAVELNRLERELLKAARPTPSRGQPISLRAMEHAVRELTQQLFDFSIALADLEQDAHGLEIARDAIAQILRSSSAPANGGGFSGSFLFKPVERFGRQMRSDQAFYRTTEQRGRVALESLRTLAQIEQARMEARLVIVGILLGSFIGVGHILHEMELWPRLLVSLGAGLAVTALYWFWSGSKVA